MIAAALALLAQAAASSPPPRPPQLMLLGTVHLANNNRDIANVPVEDVLTPARQREIAALVDALAKWKPTRVAIEWPAKDQAGLDRRYADYRAGRLAPSASERDQIGLRLAAKLGLARVEAIDWNEMPPMTVAALDFAGWAKANGQGARLAAFRARGQAQADALAATHRCTTIASWYRALNTPEERVVANRPYFEIARYGDAAAQPGAVWVGNWYARNLRIFGNLQAAARPGERVFVLYGAGHAYLLDRFARDSGAFAVVDPRRWLPPARRIPCK